MDRQPSRLKAMAEILGHQFADSSLLLLACTHASFLSSTLSATERRQRSNERLEFLGDALLGAMAALIFFEDLKDADEGHLSRLKAEFVSRKSLAQAMTDSGLLTWCRVGTQLTDPWPDSIRANLAEALLAAVYLDGGWDKLRQAMQRLLGRSLSAVGGRRPAADDKNLLQEWALSQGHALPTYVTNRSGGPDHQPEYRSQVTVGPRRGEGRGRSRREAETAAARMALAAGSDPA